MKTRSPALIMICLGGATISAPPPKPALAATSQTAPVHCSLKPALPGSPLLGKIGPAWTVSCLAGSVAGTGVVNSVELQRDEPRYQDRPLSSWVKTLVGARASDLSYQQAIVAIRSIGTNALPLLLEWIQHEAEPWKGTSAEIQELLSRSPPDWPPGRGPREYLAIAADRAFWVLGTQALPALPELTRLMNDASQPQTACRAAATLRAFGTNSLPALLRVVDKPGHPCRTSAILALEIMGRDVGPDMAPAVPHLIACLTNGPAVDGWAARALGEYKFASQLIIPALKNQLASDNPYLRSACQKALNKLDPPDEDASLRRSMGETSTNQYAP